MEPRSLAISRSTAGSAIRRTAARWAGAAKYALLLTALAAVPLTPGRAAVLFSDNFESGVFGSQWASNASTGHTLDPLGAGHGLVIHFMSFGAGGDLFSQLIPYVLGGPVTLEFDFTQIGTVNSGAYVGTDHQTTPFGVEQWILSTDGGSAYPNLNFSAPGAWQHISLTFTPYDPGSVGSFALKLEQFNVGNGLGNAYFDNILITDTTPEPTPEPSSVEYVLISLCAVPVWVRYRRRKV